MLLDGAGASTASTVATPAQTPVLAGATAPAATVDSPKREPSSWGMAGPALIAAAVAAVLLVLYGLLVLRAPESPASLPDASENGSTGAPPSSVADEPASPSVEGGSAIGERTREVVTAPVLQLEASFTDALSSGGEGPEIVVIPAGQFLMGCVSGQDCFDNEMPVHEVTIAEAFAVSRYEVTFAEWDLCLERGGCGGIRPDDEDWGRGNRPVVNVSWEDAREYAAWLSGQTGATYRLLSEAEWEYVARAGSSTAFSWGNEIGVNRANCGDWETYDLGTCGDRWGNTAPVGSFEPNAFGVHDMHGNVYEWVEDCWNESYAGAPSDGTAWRSGDCTRHMARGGSWSVIPRFLSSAYRYGNTAGNRNYSKGFRVARTLTH